MEEYKAGTQELEEIKKTINTLKGKLTTLENKKSEIEKTSKDLIAQTIYQKREEIERSYSEVIKEAEIRLKASEKEKEVEKKKNLDKIVEQKTRGVRENNLYLHNEIKKILKDNRLPGFVDSGFYMTIWNPKKISEVMGVMFTIVIIFAISTVISFVTFREKLLQLFPNDILRYIVIILIYFAVIFVFGLIWLIIDKITKKRQDVINKIAELRQNIQDNKKDIQKITRDIENSASSDNYDYTRLDRDIEANKLEVENYKNKRKEAMDNFVNVTQDEIMRTIEAKSSKDIDLIVTEMENVKAELSKMQTRHDELKLKMAAE